MDVPSTIVLEADQDGVNIELGAKGSEGKVMFDVKGLPDSMRQEGNLIKGKTVGLKGSFPILV